MPIIVIAGEEELLMCERLDEHREKLLDPAWAAFNYSRIEKPELKDVIDAAASVPFGPGNKVIVFERCELFGKKRGKDDSDDAPAKASGKAKERLLDDLDSSLSAVAPNTWLIFLTTGNFDKTLKVSKVFEKHASIEDFPKIKHYLGGASQAMINFCGKRAKSFGATIDDGAIEYLADSSEGDLRQIAAEIEKSATYLASEKSRHITYEVVARLSPHYAGIFALLDFWAAGRACQVLETVEELLGRQSSALPIMAMMQTTFSKWITIRTAIDQVLQSMPLGRGVQRRELPPAELAKRIQNEIKMNPYVLKMECERVAKISLERLVEKKRELTTLERFVKSGMLKDRQALTIFFTR